MDLKKYKGWTPNQGVPANIEYRSPVSKFWATWKSRIVIGGLLTLISGAVYMAVIRPMNQIENWQKVQSKNRAGIKQEDVQPGGMRVWSSPFQSRKE